MRASAARVVDKKRNEALKAFEELTCDATVPDDVDGISARYAHEKYGHIAGKARTRTKSTANRRQKSPLTAFATC